MFVCHLNAGAAPLRKSTHISGPESPVSSLNPAEQNETSNRIGANTVHVGLPTEGFVWPLRRLFPLLELFAYFVTSNFEVIRWDLTNAGRALLWTGRKQMLALHFLLKQITMYLKSVECFWFWAPQQHYFYKCNTLGVCFYQLRTSWHRQISQTGQQFEVLLQILN